MLTNDPWPGNTDGAILPGGAAVYENKLFVFGGFDIGIGMTDTIWQFDPAAAEGSRWTQMTAHVADADRLHPDRDVEWPDLSSRRIDLGRRQRDDPRFGGIVGLRSGHRHDHRRSTPIPRATAETRAVTQPDGTVWVLGGGRDAPNPSNEVDIYDPATDTWTHRPRVHQRRAATSRADIDPATGNIWAVGGYDTDGMTLLSINEQFTGVLGRRDRHGSSRTASTGR